MMKILKRHSEGMLSVKADLCHYPLWLISAAEKNLANLTSSLNPLSYEIPSHGAKPHILKSS